MPDSFKISVLISGGGTTLKNLIDRSGQASLGFEIVQVISNNPDARGLQFAADIAAEPVVVDHRDFDSVDEFSDSVFQAVRRAGVDLVVMGGFLRRVAIPTDFVNRVVNIHPSLIPAFCGKGHYGKRVHRAVLDYGGKVSGCTVHFVDDQYDHGPIIAQQSVEVQPKDTADTLAARVFGAECELYPRVIAAIAAGRITVDGRTVRWA